MDQTERRLVRKFVTRIVCTTRSTQFEKKELIELYSKMICYPSMVDKPTLFIPVQLAQVRETQTQAMEEKADFAARSASACLRAMCRAGCRVRHPVSARARSRNEQQKNPARAHGRYPKLGRERLISLPLRSYFQTSSNGNILFCF